MESRVSEISTLVSGAVVKEEPMDQSSGNQDSQQTHLQTICTDDDNERRNECTPESQEHEDRAFLNKCVFCDKQFTCDEDSKLLECLHAACSACVNNKLADSNASVDADVLRK